MSAHPRQQLLLDEVRRTGSISVEALASRLEVTASRVDVLVTDAPPPQPFERLLDEHAVRCLVAGAS